MSQTLEERRICLGDARLMLQTQLEKVNAGSVELSLLNLGCR